MIIKFDKLGLVGRLGNSLYQLAATIGLAEKYGCEARFNADWIHRSCFSVPDELFEPCSDAVEAFTLPELNHIDSRARIYMQDYSLCEPVMPLIRAYLKPNANTQTALLENTTYFELRRPILSVHVRRGDNVPGQDPGVPDKHNYYVLPALSYYKAAIESFGNVVNSVAVFSDDPTWCEENLGDVADYIHHGQSRPKEHEHDWATAPVLDHLDLLLQVQANYHIVTGSTFGIWGALLADDNNAVRCAPVYGPKLDYVNADLMFPSSWKVLPAC